MAEGTTIKTGWDTLQFGFIGYGIVEGVKQLKDPLIFSCFTVLDSGSAAGITAIHTLIDSAVHKIFENLFKEPTFYRSHYSFWLQGIRHCTSVLTAASIARLINLTPSIATAISVILVSQIAFSLITFVLNYHHANKFSSNVICGDSKVLGSFLKAAYDLGPTIAFAFAGVEIIKRMEDPFIFSSFKELDTSNLVLVSAIYSLVDSLAFRIFETIFNKWDPKSSHLNEAHTPRLIVARQSISVLTTSYLSTLAKLTPNIQTAAAVILVSQGMYTCMAFLLRNYDHGRYNAFPTMRVPDPGHSTMERY